jgi:putative redox protein
MTTHTEKLTFEGSLGAPLAARLDMPLGQPKAYAIFAHCFTCSKDTHAAARVSDALAAQGIAVLRFDFTGLGGSGGDFANTNFSSNLADLKLAADYLRRQHQPPQLLIGHSLGGTAVLAVAADIPEVRAVATINSPADAEHVVHAFAMKADAIERDGEAEVTLAGRTFRIRRDFITDVRAHDMAPRIRQMKKALLVLHAPADPVVGIENAARIFDAALHPKSFISIDGADHLLTRKQDASYVASVLASWAARYLTDVAEPAPDSAEDSVVVREAGLGKFTQTVHSGAHMLTSDEPASVGGNDLGPSPYDFLSIALGTCTSMTLRLYAEHKKLDLGRISVRVSHAKIHAEDCADCEGRVGRIDRFERVISVEGDIDDALRAKLVEIAGKCPVHRTLEHQSVVATRVA